MLAGRAGDFNPDRVEDYSVAQASCLHVKKENAGRLVACATIAVNCYS